MVGNKFQDNVQHSAADASSPFHLSSTADLQQLLLVPRLIYVHGAFLLVAAPRKGSEMSKAAGSTQITFLILCFASRWSLPKSRPYGISWSACVPELFHILRHLLPVRCVASYSPAFFVGFF
ncbi:hypothetical protein COLO4_02668 [Corchorus olitorius]|uniref:Uncharacterized protein n=1 Tax=Corchorus olitorius TaxID=93759 RepID=A0A1R3L0L0_9ROSI|nr:hypothetical protein COLO4_02668 [Corchorus olitorius]